MENYLEYIDAYFSGTLSAEEKKQFERRIHEDNQFAKDVAYYLSAKQASREELIKDKKEWFRQLASQNVTPSQKVRSLQVTKMWVYRLAAAAVVVGIIFLSWSLFVSYLRFVYFFLLFICSKS